MKPPAFRYIAPRSVEEALGVLDKHPDDARILAGGQSLVPMMNLRLAFPGVLIDLNRIADLGYMMEREDGVAIGAMTRQRTIEHAPVVRRRVPLVAAALRYVGHFQIRTRGTVGGSIAHADPAAELPAILLALDGEVTARSLARGPRRIQAAELFCGHFTTALRPDEMITEVFFPAHLPGCGWSFREFARRHGDYALAGVAVMLVADNDRIQSAAISLLGVGSTPIRASGVETLMAAADLHKDAAGLVEDAVRDEVNPTDNFHGSGEYRRHLAAVLARRAVADALQMTIA